MRISTWHNILDGIHSATYTSIMRKSVAKRNQTEVSDVMNNFDTFCDDVKEDIRSGKYKVGDYRHFLLKDKKKNRDISVLPFKDRCVQNAVKDAIQPVLIKYMTDDMMGGLPERGVQSSINRWCVIRRMRKAMQNENNVYYLKGDIRKFYDTINNVVVMRLIEQRIKDKRTLAIIKEHLFKQKRLAIGDPFSHLLANLVMSGIVRQLKASVKNIEAINFADDIIVFAKDKETLEQSRRILKSEAKKRRMHYKTMYIRRVDESPVQYCGFVYTRDTVKLSKRTKKRYIKARHSRRSMSSYNGMLMLSDSKHLRYLIEINDNKHMGDKIRRPFAGKSVKTEELVGIRHTIVRAEERKSRQTHSDNYMHVQAIAEGLGLIVYSTSSPKIVQYIKENTVPMRDLIIVKDWSGFYYEGTVYTDEEEEAMIRQQFNINL